ncbi:MAG: creatininase family protein [Oscillochloridaceae bacterium umkhey_bin13]
MTTTLPWNRYVELRPEQLDYFRATIPILYLPCGGLAWRGPHLPVGLGTIMAEHVAERVVRRTGGVLLPTLPWPSAGIPHPASLVLSSTTTRSVLDELLAQIAQSGWQIVVLVGGHYSQAHDLICMEAAEAAIKQHDLLVLALPPLAMVDEEMLDHGALWETSAMLAIRPELVQLDQLGTDPMTPHQSGVVGRDPRLTASASLGASALGLAVERISIAVNDLRAKDEAAPLLALYQRRRDHYRAFLQRYGDEPVAAVRAWWTSLSTA